MDDKLEWLLARLDQFGARTYGVGPVCREAATALRAFAEREKELVEALEPFADVFDWSEKGAPAWGGLRKTDFAKARAILSKHKEQK